MKAYKGFDKDLKCRGFQYEIGKEYEEKGASLCNKGFHACEDPLDCFSYYNPAESRFCEVEIEDNGERESNSKVCGEKIKIGAEIGIPGLVKAAVEYVTERAKPSKAHHTKKDSVVSASTGGRSVSSSTGRRSVSSSTGDSAVSASAGGRSVSLSTGGRSVSSSTGDFAVSSSTGGRSVSFSTGDSAVSSSTGWGSVNSSTGDSAVSASTGGCAVSASAGDCSVSSSTGWRSVSLSTGWGSANISTGKECTNNGEGERNICVAWGKDSKCKGALGCFLVLSEWGMWDGQKYRFIGAKMVEVDGETIKADTWYWLKDGEVVECE